MDTFFTYYFIIVGGLLIVTIIYEALKFLIRHQDDWQFELADGVLNWCLELYPSSKKKPQLIMVDGPSDYAGECSFHKNTIYLYRENNLTPKRVIHVLIHEFFHFYLITSDAKNQLYQKQIEIYGVDNHPQEILCEALASELTKRYLRS